jgi:hypothetical protein
MRKKWLKSNWKRILVIIVCVALIVVHSIWSQLKFDSINIWLGAIAILLFLMPNLNFLFPYLRRVKRFKAWELEFELSDLEEKVEKAEAEAADSGVSKNVSPEVEEVLKEASKDPRAALLLLSSKIDTVVRKRLEDAKLLPILKGGVVRYPRTNFAIEMGISQGLFPPTALSAYNDFRGIRNEIAHNYIFQVDDATILSLISLGTQLLKVLSTEKPEGKEMPPQ